MKRMKVLFGKRRVLVLATLAILVIAAAALVASSASFTASSSNGPNVFTAGELLVPGGVPGTALFTVTGMKPGDITPAQNVTVTNPAGSVNAKLTLSGTVNNALPNYDAAFENNLLITIVEDPAGANRTIVAGLPLGTALTAAIPLNNNVQWIPGDSHVYRITVQFKDNGVDAAGNGNDNVYMNKSGNITLIWKAISN